MKTGGEKGPRSRRKRFIASALASGSTRNFAIRNRTMRAIDAIDEAMTNLFLSRAERKMEALTHGGCP
jgi:hypothetical protein